MFGYKPNQAIRDALHGSSEHPRMTPFVKRNMTKSPAAAVDESMHHCERSQKALSNPRSDKSDDAKINPDAERKDSGLQTIHEATGQVKNNKQASFDNTISDATAKMNKIIDEKLGEISQ